MINNKTIQRRKCNGYFLIDKLFYSQFSFFCTFIVHLGGFAGKKLYLCGEYYAQHFL